jgi:hypothetical protein
VYPWDELLHVWDDEPWPETPEGRRRCARREIEAADRQLASQDLTPELRPFWESARAEWVRVLRGVQD